MEVTKLAALDVNPLELWMSPDRSRNGLSKKHISIKSKQNSLSQSLQSPTCNHLNTAALQHSAMLRNREPRYSNSPYVIKDLTLNYRGIPNMT